MPRVKSEDIGKIRPRSLQALRLKDGLTVSALARLAKIDQSYLHRIEAGEKNPLPSVALRLANALGVPLELIYDTNADSGFELYVLAVPEGGSRAS